jgi:mannose-1-phosphate guanylyltransferase
VESFHEKPDPDTAARYVEEGYLWNTGIFVWRASRLLQEVREHTPEIAGLLHHLERGDAEAFFDAVPKISVDVAVMERSQRVAVVPATFRWDDVGAWHSLFRTRGRDEADNVVLGDGHAPGRVAVRVPAPAGTLGARDGRTVRRPPGGTRARRLPGGGSGPGGGTR